MNEFPKDLEAHAEQQKVLYEQLLNECKRIDFRLRKTTNYIKALNPVLTAEGLDVVKLGDV